MILRPGLCGGHNITSRTPCSFSHWLAVGLGSYFTVFLHACLELLHGTAYSVCSFPQKCVIYNSLKRSFKESFYFKHHRFSILALSIECSLTDVKPVFLLDQLPFCSVFNGNSIFSPEGKAVVSSVNITNLHIFNAVQIFI